MRRQMAPHLGHRHCTPAILFWQADALHILSYLQTRYTAVRRQTAPGPGEKETQVLDYQNVATELVPLIAAAYALKFMGQV